MRAGPCVSSIRITLRTLRLSSLLARDNTRNYQDPRVQLRTTRTPPEYMPLRARASPRTDSRGIKLQLHPAVCIILSLGVRGPPNSLIRACHAIASADPF